MTAAERKNMALTEFCHREFLRRLGAIPVHGLGLSVDIHSPDLTSLRRRLQERQVSPVYLEVFRTTTKALVSAKKEIGNGLLAYHGEGLWVTHPGVTESQAFRQAVSEAVDHLQVLQSAWLNHECATKFLAGYYYGTYVPPLYTQTSAEVVADNTRLTQSLLDQQCCLPNGGTPLMLLEMPPLTYFVAGTLSIPEFFRVVTDQSPCGLVLDVGHLWTVFRYSGAYRAMSLTEFVDTFLSEFPLHRVVEIHVAGLAVHESSGTLASRPSGLASEGTLPAWIDAHAAPIPCVLFEMLDQILAHPRLTSLKGLALEVDTKPVELIVDEFAEFSRRYAHFFERRSMIEEGALERDEFSFKNQARTATTTRSLEEGYDHYANVLARKAEPSGAEWGQDLTRLQDLDLYRSAYLPHEILHWGGDLEDMFVESCRRLRERGVSFDGFVTFWFREPRPLCETYDFFLLKVERFVEFVQEMAPELLSIVEKEAEELRQAYRFANEPDLSVHTS